MKILIPLQKTKDSNCLDSRQSGVLLDVRHCVGGISQSLSTSSSSHSSVGWA